MEWFPEYGCMMSTTASLAKTCEGSDGAWSAGRCTCDPAESLFVFGGVCMTEEKACKDSTGDWDDNTESCDCVSDPKTDFVEGACMRPEGKICEERGYYWMTAPPACMTPHATKDDCNDEEGGDFKWSVENGGCFLTYSGKE